jgi:hypothetical protein
MVIGKQIKMRVEGSRGRWMVQHEHEGILWESGVWSQKKECEQLMRSLKNCKWMLVDGEWVYE